MDDDHEPPALRERVKWGNVAKAAAVAVLIAIVLAWPRLSPDGPALPEEEAVVAPDRGLAPSVAAPAADEAAPVGEQPAPAKPRVEKPRAEKPRKEPATKGRRTTATKGRRNGAKRRPAPSAPVTRAAPAAPPPAVSSPSPAPAPVFTPAPPQSTGAAEFGGGSRPHPNGGEFVPG